MIKIDRFGRTKIYRNNSEKKNYEEAHVSLQKLSKKMNNNLHFCFCLPYKLICFRQFFCFIFFFFFFWKFHDFWSLHQQKCKFFHTILWIFRPGTSTYKKIIMFWSYFFVFSATFVNHLIYLVHIIMQSLKLFQRSKFGLEKTRPRYVGSANFIAIFSMEKN